MTLWKVTRHFYINSDTPVYDVMPYNLVGHLKCCWKYYGWSGLKWCYLLKWQADKKAEKLNRHKLGTQDSVRRNSYI